MNLSNMHDVLLSEYRSDHSLHFPATLLAPNGSLCCATDYELCGVLGKEILEVSS